LTATYAGPDRARLLELFVDLFRFAGPQAGGVMPRAMARSMADNVVSGLGVIRDRVRSFVRMPPSADERQRISHRKWARVTRD